LIIALFSYFVAIIRVHLAGGGEGTIPPAGMFGKVKSPAQIRMSEKRKTEVKKLSWAH
jgi:hypothetical protein